MGVSRSTIYRWTREPGKEEFRDMLERILGAQELVLWNKGLTGEFNPAITKLLLGKHGYHDKQDHTHSGVGFETRFSHHQ